MYCKIQLGAKATANSGGNDADIIFVERKNVGERLLVHHRALSADM